MENEKDLSIKFFDVLREMNEDCDNQLQEIIYHAKRIGALELADTTQWLLDSFKKEDAEIAKSKLNCH